MYIFLLLTLFYFVLNESVFFFIICSVMNSEKLHNYPLQKINKTFKLIYGGRREKIINLIADTLNTAIIF